MTWPHACRRQLRLDLPLGLGHAANGSGPAVASAEACAYSSRPMSLDRSLKAGGSLVRHRNVLNRSERLARLLKEGRMTEDKPFILGLPKVANRKVAVAKKSGKKAEGEGAAEGVPGTSAPAAATPAAAPAAAAKTAAPAKKK